MTKRFLFMLLALSFAPFIAKVQSQDISPAPLGHDTPINRAPPDWQRLKNYLASEGIGHATAALKTADLDDDGDLDVIAKLTGPSWCGTGGCTLLVLENDGERFVLLNRITISQGISIKETRSAGWRDFWVHRSGGGAKLSVDIFKFDGAFYVLSEKRYLAEIAENFVREDQTFIQDGYNLKLEDYSYSRDCKNCFVYSYAFEHYGDPCFIYKMDVMVQDGIPLLYGSENIPNPNIPKPCAQEPFCQIDSQ